MLKNLGGAAGIYLLRSVKTDRTTMKTTLVLLIWFQKPPSHLFAAHVSIYPSGRVLEVRRLAPGATITRFFLSLGEAESEDCYFLP